MAARLQRSPTIPRAARVRRQRGRAPSVLLGAVALAALGVGGWYGFGRDTTPVYGGPVRPLTISVSEAGTIEAREKVVLKCEVDERSTTITSIVEEGAWVEKGDVVVELDASVLQDELYDEEIDVLDTEAEFYAAREGLEVVKNQSLADLSVAELTLRFAREDVKKYVEGEFPKQLMEATNRVTLAEERLQQATDRLAWSQKLADKGFLASTELDRDRLAEKSAQLDVELARAEVALLKEYTQPRQLDQLQSDVSQAELALERVRRRTQADLVQAETNLQAREKQLERQRAQLADIQRQVARCTIEAPVAGMVVYATSGQGNWRGNEEPLAVGREVRQQEELVYIPVAEAKSAFVKVHESALDKVHVGQDVRITVDALPERAFQGRLARISPLPDAQSQWLNPDLKVFETEIHLLGNLDGLRTGMTCRAEVLVQQFDDTLSVPIHSVVRVGGESTVFVVQGGELLPRRVQVGLDNNRMIQVVSGVQEGELVALAPPLEDTDAPLDGVWGAGSTGSGAAGAAAKGGPATGAATGNSSP